MTCRQSKMYNRAKYRGNYGGKSNLRFITRDMPFRSLALKTFASECYLKHAMIT